MTRILTLKCVPPFDFDLSLRLFSGGDRQIRKYEEGKFWQVVRIDRKLVLVTLEALGTVDKPEVSARLESVQMLSANDDQKTRQLACALIDADFDLEPFYTDVKKDRIMADIVHKLGGLKIPSAVTVFEALIDSIIEQQISLNVAHVLQTNLIRTFGDSLSLDTGVYYGYPTPQELASTRIEKIRKCGLSTRKAEYIRDISRMVAERKLNLEAFKRYKDVNKIIEELDEIKGIGIWTAELTIVRGMQKYEAIPADDLGLRRTISHFYCKDRKITGDEARRIAEKWGKWKGLASFYLIVADMLEQDR
jgi:DNA-3-methyladenine glycosylase II